MKISDYAGKKYAKGMERDSFNQRWKEFDLDINPVDFFKNIIISSSSIFICDGISMLGELEIRETKLEEIVLVYCRQIMYDSDFTFLNTRKYDIFESIIWVLGEIGSIDSLEFLKDLIYNKIEELRDFVNFEHLLSASQYSFFRINQRELADFFIKIRSIREIPVKTQADIDSLRKLNPKYAEFQQFLLDNYKEYEGGGLN